MVHNMTQSSHAHIQMSHHKALPSSAPVTYAVIVAACDSLPDSQAMARWILPVLQAWPNATWHAWLADASNCDSIRAARLGRSADDLTWQHVEHVPAEGQDAVCRIIGGRTGLVVYAHHLIAHEVSRGLEGLVAALTSFPANDPLARPLKKSFASLGVSAD